MRFSRAIDHMFENRAIRQITEACQARGIFRKRTRRFPMLSSEYRQRTDRGVFHGWFLPNLVPEDLP